MKHSGGAIFAGMLSLVLTTSLPARAMYAPTADDMRAWRSYASSQPACGTALRLDDYSANPHIASASTQRRRIHAYVLCRSALHEAHAGARVGNVNAFFLGRACMIYGLTNNGAAGDLPDCN